MRLEVRFSSPLFKPVGDGDHHRRYGLELAQWLSSRLLEQGIEVETVVPGDEGWLVITAQAPFSLSVSCCLVAGEKNRWVCAIDGSPGLIQRVLHKVDPGPEVRRLQQALTAVLGTEPNIERIEWQGEPAVPEGENE